MKNQKIMFTSVLLALAGFAIFSTALAVPRPTPTPTPTATPSLGEDRGYNNSAGENVDALNISTTGTYNTAHGWHALSVNTTGTNNTANGSHALSSNLTGSYNIALGDSALWSNTISLYNIAVCTDALGGNATGGGEMESVRYNAINIMLLNEFLKEHKAFVEEQGRVTKLEAAFAGLLATVREQAAQIERVSAQVQFRKPIQSLARNIP
jgi:hypothetical protein